MKAAADGSASASSAPTVCQAPGHVGGEALQRKQEGPRSHGAHIQREGHKQHSAKQAGEVSSEEQGLKGACGPRALAGAL